MIGSAPIKKLIRRAGVGRRLFQTINITLLLLMAFICLLPFIHVISVSLSNNSYIDAGMVTFWPRGLNAQSYGYLISRASF